MKKSEFKPQGYKCLSNCVGIEVMINDRADAVIYSRYEKLAPRWQEIKYTNSGRPYFTVFGRRFHLDEFMRY